MRYIPLLAALTMPLVAWLSKRGVFGPDMASLSDRYPTLLIAADYAFSIWSVIFLLDIALGVILAIRYPGGVRGKVRSYAALGFALTAVWMPLFSLEWFVPALLVIWAALACLLYCSIALSRQMLTGRRARWAWLPLSLHAGWLALAAFLNTAQVIVAYGLLSTSVQLPWSLFLLVVAAALLLLCNLRMRGNAAFCVAALWGLVAVHVEQSRSAMDGASTTGWLALVIAAALSAQCAWLWLRPARREERPEPVSLR